MAEKTIPYIFPLTDRARLGIAMAERMKAMLENGSPAQNLPGLKDVPKFKNRSGAGNGRDTSTEVSAEVVFGRDSVGVPHVRILGIMARGPREEWGDNLWLVPCVVSLDCFANLFMPGADTPGISAESVDSILGGVVLDMFSSYESMTSWGFTWPQTTPEPPPGGVDTDGANPFEFHFPITCNFEAYMFRTEQP